MFGVYNEEPCRAGCLLLAAIIFVDLFGTEFNRKAGLEGYHFLCLFHYNGNESVINERL